MTEIDHTQTPSRPANREQYGALRRLAQSESFGQDWFVVYMMQSPSMRGEYRTLLRNMIHAAIEE
jgi:hypothetical protein